MENVYAMFPSKLPLLTSPRRIILALTEYISISDVTLPENCLITNKIKQFTLVLLKTKFNVSKKRSKQTNMRGVI